ncbi:hypothetical protein OQZ33_11515 [Pedobacter sp. MC2016-05]|uniref:hypothetical protein n=1 Tax=Pedobacter sp. MC2016-05 TaxID=2994474 RepID=UPI0022479A79|nr:hypothetical protein [Pedobacter sp. MC2016-05]MCX2474959.1 hypothetical protein [Pedobacter sp. MC2016-05]
MYLTTFIKKADRDAHWAAFGPEYKKISGLPQYEHNVSKTSPYFYIQQIILNFKRTGFLLLLLLEVGFLRQAKRFQMVSDDENLAKFILE